MLPALDDVLFAYTLATLSPVLPVALYTLTRRRRRTHWVTLTAVESDYRTGALGPRAAAPPTIAKITALLSWWLGQLAVPVVYTMVMSRHLALQVLAAPTAVIALFQFAIGAGILQADIAVIARARALSRRASAVGAVVGIYTVFFAVGVLVTALLSGGSLASVSPFAYLGALVFYAAITVVYGELLTHSADAVKANSAVGGPASVRVEATPSATPTHAHAPGDVAGSERLAALGAQGSSHDL
ncbi:MAG: hypothetical protein Q8Q09_01855 [Deltaproteobacteria bacterium]|nr:hypothetical protein [Deltaproteobacteria bacterium]